MTLRRDKTTRIYSADVRDRTAGRIHLSLKTTEKREALARYAALEALVREGDLALVSELRARRLNIEAVARCHRDRKPFAELRTRRSWPTLGDAVDRYLAWLEDHPQRSRGTATAAKYQLQSALRHFTGPRPLESLRAGDIAEYRRALETDGLKPGTVLAKLSRLSTLYAWVQRDETRVALHERREPARLYSPIDKEAVPARPEPRVRFLSDAETERLVAATPDRLQLLIALGLLLGLRADEARVLRPPPFDVDLDVGLVLVQPHELHTGVVWRPKSKASKRELPIPDAMRPILDRHLVAYANERWLFPALPGATGKASPGPMSYPSLKEAMNRIVVDAELVPGRSDPQGVSFHVLRHTFAANLVMGGVDLYTTSRLLGHASTKEVEEVYGHLSPEHRRAAIAVLNDRLKAAYRPLIIVEKKA